YLELMLAMNENAISGNLQNEMDTMVLLKRLPQDALYEERALLLGKMNQHELALSLYVHKLHVPELALSYCDRVYESMHQHLSDGDTDEFNEGGSTIMLDEVLDLLSRRWDRINGAQALKLLPRETKLQDLLSFLGPLLRKSSEMYRNYSVIKSLRQSENLQVKDELYSQRKSVVK
ncbi:Vam6/Vps39-like protein, partial [Trifolium pratense]